MPIVVGCFQLSLQPHTVNSSEREDADTFRLFFHNFGFSQQRYLLGSLDSLLNTQLQSASFSSLEHNIFYITWVPHKSQKNDCEYHSISQSCEKMYHLHMEINVFLILLQSSKKTHEFFSVPGGHHDGQMQSH